MDGANRISKPGMAACAWALFKGPEEQAFGCAYLGPETHTNNYAEWQALLRLLRWLYEQKITDVLIHSDSMLVIEQTMGRWEIKQEEFRPYAAEAYGLLTQGHHRLLHVRGHGKNENATDNERNDYVDKLCNQVLDRQEEINASKT